MKKILPILLLFCATCGAGELDDLSRRVTELELIVEQMRFRDIPTYTAPQPLSVEVMDNPSMSDERVAITGTNAAGYLGQYHSNGLLRAEITTNGASSDPGLWYTNLLPDVNAIQLCHGDTSDAGDWVIDEAYSFEVLSGQEYDDAGHVQTNLFRSLEDAVTNIIPPTVTNSSVISNHFVTIINNRIIYYIGGGEGNTNVYLPDGYCDGNVLWWDTGANAWKLSDCPNEQYKVLQWNGAKVIYDWVRAHD